MPEWQFRVVVAACAVVSLVPLALCLPLWKHFHEEILTRWRRVVSDFGLSMATGASLVPPLWLFTMTLLSRTKDNQESPVLGFLLVAVFVGVWLAIFAAVALCFAKGRLRWVGVASCAVTLVLFLLSFTIPTF
jgi:hypothetical protein